MATERINVFTYDMYMGSRQYAGHFDRASAEKFISAEDSDAWDDTRTHAELFRTKGGRWVRCDWNQWQGSTPHRWFIGEDEAERWLLAEGHDEAVQRFFGEVAEESGPNLGGRPGIGPKVDTRLDPETLARVDALRNGRDRADVLRELIAAGLGLVEHPAG